MKPDKVVSEIDALARRVRSGSTAIGDFLRVQVNLRFMENNNETLRLDAATFDAMKRLCEAVRSGFQKGDETYRMLTEKLSLIYYGLGTGQLKSSFFARIGV